MRSDYRLDNNWALSGSNLENFQQKGQWESFSEGWFSLSC